MDLEVAVPVSAVFTYCGVAPRYECGTALRKDAGRWDTIGDLLRRWVSWDVLQCGDFQVALPSLCRIFSYEGALVPPLSGCLANGRLMRTG